MRDVWKCLALELFKYNVFKCLNVVYKQKKIYENYGKNLTIWMWLQKLIALLGCVFFDSVCHSGCFEQEREGK